jgi:hypothetical protein
MKAGRILSVAVLVLLGAGVQAQTWKENQVLYSASRDYLVGYLRSLGYAPSNVKEKTISVKLQGYPAFISVNPNDLQIYSWFTGPADPSLINRFNANYRFASAYWNEANDICVQSDLDLEGGVTLGAIGAWVQTFGALLDDYTKLE